MHKRYVFHRDTPVIDVSYEVSNRYREPVRSRFAVELNIGLDGQLHPERFIQSALREWAYGWTYQNSAQRTAALASWQYHYNWHRPHHGIGRVPPITRLPASGNNLLTLHS